MGGSAPLFDKATIHETDAMAGCIVNADVPEAGETEEAQEADEFEEAGNAEGAAEAEQAEEEGVPPARRGAICCLYVVLWIFHAAAQTTQAEDAEDAAAPKSCIQSCSQTRRTAGVSWFGKA